MKKVLYVCTVPALESYSIGVLSAVFQSDILDAYAYVFLAENDNRSAIELLTAYSIPSFKSDKIKFLNLPVNRVKRILKARKYLSEVASFGSDNAICIAHFISQDIMLSGNLDKFKSFELYYTVHDLIPHESKLNAFQKLKHYYFKNRKDKLLINNIRNLVTNSQHQKLNLQEWFPQKKISIHQMPSLVTPSIKGGSLVVSELENKGPYVLFFGRIESYKGLEELYNVFTTSKRLKGVKLVIAGYGKIYFERNTAEKDSVIFINRYIADEEMNDLFSKALFFLMPYRSATQSAVSSLAYNYNLPIIASNIEGLRDTVIHEQSGLLYDLKDETGLESSIFRLISDKDLKRNITEYIANSNHFYQEYQLVRELEKIY